MKQLAIFIGMLFISLSSIIGIASATHSNTTLSAKTLTLAWNKAHHSSQALNKGDIMMGYAGQDVYQTSLLHAQTVTA